MGHGEDALQGRLPRLEGQTGRDGEAMNKEVTMEPTVSIIVPVFNAEPYLDRCITSVLNQSYRALELILVDDGSSDKSQLICEKYRRQDDRVILHHQENQGVSSARNTGLFLASGEYLTFADADDSLAPNTLETAMRLFQQYDADMVTYGWNIVHENGSSTEQVFEKFEIQSNISSVLKNLLMHYSSYGGGYPWNKVWKRDSAAFPENFLPFDQNLYYFEDLEWVVRMLLKVRKIVVCPECLYDYYIRENSITRSPKQAERRELGYHHSIERIIEDLSVLPELQKWFSNKYYPEIVNGIITASRKHQEKVTRYLFPRLQQVKKDLLKSKQININIKLRCLILLLLGA